jgi:16S rRNA (cytosine967-C5)-methyltransferase
MAKHRATPGRVATAQALVLIEGGAHADDALAKLAPPEGPDRGLTWHLVLGIQRRRGAVDALIRPHLRTAMAKLQPEVRACLRMGVFEQHATRTQAHAAVHQAVEASRALGVGRASGLINAVLRKTGQGELPEDPFLDLPPWLAERWADWAPWVARMRDPSPLCVVLKDPGADQWMEILGGQALQPPGPCPQGMFRLPEAGGAVHVRPGFAEGEWWIMDPASVAVADLALGTEGSRPRVLDACAAPGGKSFRMLSMGAEVVSVDSSGPRLEKLMAGAERLGLAVDARQHDWSRGPMKELGSFDVVLVDAPCSGLGTVRRRPELRWRLNPRALERMPRIQAQVLQAAAHHVAPGGHLV